MSIKSETIAKLLFKSACYDKIFCDNPEEPYLDKEYQELINKYLEEWGESIKSPIEQIMYAILMNCKNGYTYVSAIPEDIYPFFYYSVVNHQEEIGRYKCDFVIHTCIDEKIKPHNTHTISKLAIECDGHDFHEKTKEQVARDKKRDRFFVSEGYKLLRYSGSEIYNNFESIIEEITEILANDVSGWEDKNYKTFRRLIIGDKVE